MRSDDSVRYVHTRCARLPSVFDNTSKEPNFALLVAV